MHGQSVYSILNKKILTKSLLFDYVSQHNSLTGTTKTEIIERIVQLWKDKYSKAAAAASVPQCLTPTTTQPNVVINIVNNHTVNTTIHQQPAAPPPPLQLMSEEFCNWFFERINRRALFVESDLWGDVTSAIRLIDATGNTQDLEACGADQALASFQRLHDDFHFQLAPNICPTGVQGKMNSYGMVMIASCGTVYRANQFVGVFEGGFGLLKDPTSSDSWKLKHSKMQIKSVAGQTIHPQLEDCESLREILALPEQEEDPSSGVSIIKQ